MTDTVTIYPIMKKLLPYILILLLLLSSGLWAEEEIGQFIDHDRAADDLKFSNGRQFLVLRRPGKAKVELEEYLEIFHDGNHRAEAYLILGKIAYDTFKYQKAVSIYQRLYEEYSNTDEGAEALFRSGLCFRKMGFGEKATAAFRLLVADHPSSVFSPQARMHIDLLKILKNQ